MKSMSRPLLLHAYVALLWTSTILRGKANTISGSGETSESENSTAAYNHTLVHNNTKELPTAGQNDTSATRPDRTPSTTTLFTNRTNKTDVNVTVTTITVTTTRTTPNTMTKQTSTIAASTRTRVQSVLPTHTTSATSQTPATDASVGTCELYRGGDICKPYRANESVYVDPNPKYSQGNMTNFLNYLLQQLSSSVLSSSPEWSTCRGEILEGLCRYFFPNCTITPSGTVLRALICRESCEEVFINQSRPCTNVFLKAAGASILLARLQNFQPAHVEADEFGCLSTVLPSKKESNYTCMSVLASTEPQTVAVTTERTGDIFTCGGTAPPGSRCAFPFFYRGVMYTECTKVNSFESWKPWCSTVEGDYDLYRQWGICDCSNNTIGVPDGKCEIYKANSVCDSYRKGQNVFVDLRYNQTYLDEVAIQPINASLWHATQDDVCRSKALNMLCQIAYPDCIAVPNVGAFPASLCQETCTSLISTLTGCSQPILNFLNIFTTVFIDKKLNPVHVYVSVPECDMLPTAEEANGLCNGMSNANSGESDSSPKSEGLSDTNTVVVIVVTILGGITFLVLGITLFKCYKTRSHRKGKLSKNSGYVSATEILSFQNFGEGLKNKDLPQKMSVQELLLLRSSQLNSMEYDSSNIPDFSIDKIKYVKSLGEGAFGQVFMGIADLDCSGKEIPIAAKVLKQGSGHEVREDFEKELCIMSQLKHPNILQLLAKYITEEPFCMIFEFMKHGDLNYFLRLTKIGTSRNIPDNSTSQFDQDPSSEFKPFTVTVADLCSAVKQICSGLAYLSKNRFVHRDLATRNCLVGEDLVIKIADFGLSRSVYTTDYYRVTGGSLLPIRWMPPESLMYGLFTEKSDVWSFGVLTWEIFTLGKQPYFGWSNEDVIARIKNGTTLPPPDEFCPAEMYSLMRRCWIQDPKQRPDALSLLNSLENDKTN